MPSHLATMGFYVLRVRSNLVEIGWCWTVGRVPQRDPA